MVIHITPSVAKESSGPSYSVTRLCESLIETGVEVKLLTLECPLIESPNYVYLKTFPQSGFIERLGSSKLMRKWMIEYVKKNTVSIFHNHGMWQMNALYPNLISIFYGVKVVTTPRGTLSRWSMNNGHFIKKFFWIFIQKPLLKNTTCFQATSYSEYKDIRRLGFKQPVCIIPNGVDIPKLQIIKKTKMRKILFLGRVHKKKGLDMLIDAWSQIYNLFPDWELNIVGDDKDYYGVSGYLSELKSKVSKENIERVIFCGEILGQEKVLAYQSADLFVLPTYSENFGLTVAEAMASSTPVIVTKGAPWSQVAEYSCGWWIDIGVDPLVECLKTSLSLPVEELQAMGLNGRNWMKRDFSWSSISYKLNATYQWLDDQSLDAPEYIKRC